MPEHRISRAANRVRDDACLRARLNGPNGLNAVRLGLAWFVLISHSWPLTGAGDDPRVGEETLGAIAVAGFFAISGYLITGSRLTLSLFRFAWHRALRIFPGFWVMLVVVAFALAPIVSVQAGEHWTARAAAHHIAANWTTSVGEYGITGTLSHTPHGPSWNGSIWTLWFELLCYVIIGVAFSVPSFRRSPRWTAGATVAVLVANLSTEHLPGGRLEELLLPALHFAGLFGAGATLRMYADRIPHRRHLAVAAVVGLLASCLVGELDSIGAFPVAYLALWVGSRWRLVLRADLSYGVYVYAFPIQQSLVDVGFARGEPLLLTILATLLVLPVAAASWYFIERPALRGKHWRPGWPGGGGATTDRRMPPSRLRAS